MITKLVFHLHCMQLIITMAIICIFTLVTRVAKLNDTEAANDIICFVLISCFLINMYCYYYLSCLVIYFVVLRWPNW